MAYTTVPTKNPGDLLGSLDWNTYLRDNMAYLLSRPALLKSVQVAGSYSTTSTGFVDVDATNLGGTHTNLTGRVLVIHKGIYSASSTVSMWMGFSIDGANLNHGTTPIYVSNTLVTYFAYAGVTPGTHTYRLQWATSSGTLSLVKDYTTQFLVLEI